MASPFPCPGRLFPLSLDNNTLLESMYGGRVDDSIYICTQTGGLRSRSDYYLAMVVLVRTLWHRDVREGDTRDGKVFKGSK